MTTNYLLINKTIFFPEKGILAIGDLHLGYESMLQQSGMQIQFNLQEQIQIEINSIIQEIKSQNLNLKKIILLGDIKHFFKFDKSEKFEVRNFLKFLEQYLPPENIILIKGNHEKFQLDNKEYKNFHIEGDIIFTHGDTLYPEILDKKIKTIVISHIHPAVTLKEASKKEKYKGYLVGKWKRKELFIVPSFLPLIEGSEINENYKDIKEFSIISKKEMQNLTVYAIGEKGSIFEFGKLKNL
jgi:uncharacterized protein